MTNFNTQRIILVSDFATKKKKECLNILNYSKKIPKKLGYFEVQKCLNSKVSIG